MLTNEYIAYAMKLATQGTRPWTPSTYVVYMYLYAECAANGEHQLATTGKRIADALNMSESNVSGCLKILYECRLLKREDGEIQFLPPPVAFTKRLRIQQYQKNPLIDSRAREATPPGNPPPQRGGIPPQRNQPVNHDESAHDAETVSRVAAKGEAFLQKMRERMQQDRIARAIGDTFA